jgi:hypothetical protein
MAGWSDRRYPAKLTADQGANLSAKSACCQGYAETLRTSGREQPSAQSEPTEFTASDYGLFTEVRGMPEDEQEPLRQHAERARLSAEPMPENWVSSVLRLTVQCAAVTISHQSPFDVCQAL